MTLGTTGTVGTGSTLSTKEKESRELFGGLSNLITPQILAAQRRAASQAAFDRDAKKLPGVQLAAATAGRLTGEALGRFLSPRDAAMDKAQLVEDAMLAAQQETGHAIPQDQQQQAIQQATNESINEAQQAAQGGRNVVQATNPIDQQAALVTNTIKELNARGRFAEAASLAPSLNRLEQANIQRRQELAAADQAEFNIEDDVNGDTKNIVPNGTGEVTTGQVFSDGSVLTLDGETGEEVTLRPGQYIFANTQGTKGSFEDQAKKDAVKQLVGIGKMIPQLVRLRQEIFNNPNALTNVGEIAKFASSFIPDLRIFKRQTYAGNAAQLRANETLFEREMQNAGLANSQQRVAVEKLGYALAAAREGGKLSVSDVELAMKAFGGSESDPEIRMAAIDDIMRDTDVTLGVLKDLHPDFEEHALFRRATDGSAGYEQQRQKFQVKRTGELGSASTQLVAPTNVPQEGDLDSASAVFTFDDGVSIE